MRKLLLAGVVTLAMVGGAAAQVASGNFGNVNPDPPICELACNNDPLRGAFRVQSRPL